MKTFFTFTCCCCDIQSVGFVYVSRWSWGCLQKGHGSGCTRYLEHSFKEQRKASSINELPKYLPTWTSASKSSKLKAAITSLTILQQNLFWVLLSWWRTPEDQCSPKVSRVRLAEAREGRKLKCCEGTANHPASSLFPAQSKTCWSRLVSFHRHHFLQVTSCLLSGLHCLPCCWFQRQQSRRRKKEGIF